MRYIIQRGQIRAGEPRDGFPPQVTTSLPADIAVLVEGDWRYSETASGWVGQESDNNQKIYERRIALA